jgi:ferredoxin
MCATVCPSGAIAFRTREDILEHRREIPINEFIIGPQKVTTKVQMMMPENTNDLEFDVAALLPDSEQSEGKLV